MTSKKEIFHKCIVLSSVPAEIENGTIRSEVKRQHNIYVVRIENVVGAEENSKLKRWILELEGEHSVTQLKNSSLKLEIDDQVKTVKFLEPTECELPSSWISQTHTEIRNQERGKMDKDEAQKISGGQSPYQYFQYNYQLPQPPPKTFTEPAFDGSQTEILVEDIPDGVDEDVLEMYFSSKKLKQCSVKGVDYDEVERKAVIRFENPEDVKRVLDNRPIKVENTEVNVQIYVPKKLCTIIVRGPKEIINVKNKNIIEMYFENENKSKGGDIVDNDFRSEEQAFYITFEDEDVARRVVDRGGHRLKGKELTVAMLTPIRATKKDACESERDTDDSKVNHGETDPQEGKTVKVRGVKNVTDMDAIVWYFGTKRKSGGGEIAKTYMNDTDPDIIYIEYTDENVADDVVQRQHNLDGQTLDVTCFDRQEYEDSRLINHGTEILVEDIPRGVHKDLLERCFSSGKFNACTVENVDFDDVEMTAVIKFEKPRDVKTILENRPITIKNQAVSVQIYIPRKLDTVIVRGPNEVMKKKNVDTFKLYFENKKSGGGDIVKCNFRQKEHELYISFDDENAAKRVANRGVHRLMDKDITVELLIPSRSTKSSVTSHNTEEDMQSQTEPDQTYLSENYSRQILVKDIPSGVDKDHLDMLFSSKRFASCTVDEVDFNENEMSAVITFGRHEDVVCVLDKLPITIKEKVMSVQIFIPKTCDTIIVRGPKEVMKEENMEWFMMYFENKKSGGGDIAKCNFQAQEHAFIITFDKENVAQRVVDRGGHRFMNTDISVSLVSRSRSTQSSENSNVSEWRNIQGSVLDNDKTFTKSVKTIKVTGVSKVSNRESVLWYFENKKSGGADIEKRYTDDEDDDAMYIEYKEETVAKSVVGRQHVIDGHALVVTLYTPPVPPPCYTDKLLIKGLHPEIKFIVLSLFMEAKTGLSLKEGTLMYHIDQEDKVLVTVSGEINMGKLEEVCKSTPLEGSYLKFNQVPISSSVLVSKIGDLTSDTVMLYFENRKRSNGGPVKTIKMLKGSCIVEFVDYKVVDSVLSTNHTLDGREFEVRRYFPCIGRVEGDAVERPFKKPCPFKVKINEQKLKFLTRSEAYKNDGNKRLAFCHAAIDWPLDPDVNEIEISCTLSEEVKDCVKLANEWQNKTASSFDDFINTFVVARVLVVQEILESVNEELSKRKIIDKEEVMLQSEENNMYIVGTKESVTSINKIVEEIVQEKQEDMERKKSWSSVKIKNMKLIETKMFTAHQFPRQMEEKYPGSEVRICEDKNEIEIEGNNNIVNQIQVDLYVLKDTFKETNMSIPNETEAVFQSSSFKEHIEKKCKQQKIIFVWEAIKGKLYVMSQTEEMLQEAVEIVYKSVTTGILSLAQESVALLLSHQWDDIYQKLISDHLGKVSIQTTADKIRLACTDDIYNVVLHTIQDFLDTNTIYVDKLSFPKHVQTYLVQYHLQDMQDIAKNKNGQLRANKSGLEISSTKNGIQSIRKDLESLAQQVQNTQHVISKPGSPDFMKSEKGQNIVKSVANAHNVLIVSSGNESDDDYGINDQGPNAIHLPSVCFVMASCTGYGTRNMHAVVCDMTDLNVDVLVNSSDGTICLNSGLGQALLSKGGRSIEKDCQQYIATHGKLSDTAVHMSTAGHLNAKCIFHVSGPQWKGGLNKEDDILTAAVFAVLREASEKGFKSLAIPAIGCGARGYPSKRATYVIVDSVKNFFREMQDSNLTAIYLCDLKEDTVKWFVKGLEKVWGASNVRRFKDKHSSSAIPEHIRINSGVNTTHVPFKIGNICLSVKKAEIAEQNIPVIVNTTARNLNLNNGGVSKAILQKAGDEMQSELNQNFPTGIREGQVVVTKGHKLQCLNVIHGGLSKWGGQKSIQELKSFVRLCLEETQKLGHNGIAFPALGTGTLGYPKNVVANEMLIAVSEYAEKYPHSSIVNVNFIVYPQDIATVQAFEQAIAKWPGSTDELTLDDSLYSLEP